MKSLNEIMEFDLVIEVHPDGSVTDAPEGLYAPELYNDVLDGGGKPWQTFTDGYTGQCGYSGPTMHSSEFIGGSLERDILERPGYYVAILSYDTSENEGEDSEPSGWAVAYLPKER